MRCVVDIAGIKAIKIWRALFRAAVLKENYKKKFRSFINLRNHQERLEGRFYTRHCLLERFGRFPRKDCDRNLRILTDKASHKGNVHHIRKIALDTHYDSRRTHIGQGSQRTSACIPSGIDHTDRVRLNFR